MKKLLLLLFIPFLINATSLQQMFQASGPGLGYDHLIILEKDSIYTGGLIIIDESVGIKGNGAIIDLTGDSISIQGTAIFDIDACVIKGGYAGLILRSDAASKVTHCTFYGNQFGILCDGHTGYIEVENSIFSNNSSYGFACCEETTRRLRYIDMYQNALGDYMEWCPG